MKKTTEGINFYALQVRQSWEGKFIKQVYEADLDFPFKLHFPLRRLDIRKKGKIKPKQSAIFPGYVFLEIEHKDNLKDCLYTFKKLAGFKRFLISNERITPLRSNDLEIILKFISLGPVIGKSKVIYDENSKIVVLYGPLFGLEGKIVKVDRRKNRAKIKLDLYDDSFFVDLAFEVIEKAKDAH